MRSALAVLVLAAGACARAAPEADPARVQALAAAMLQNAPAPAGAAACTPAALRAGVSLTQRTLLRLAGQEVPSTPERADWINPAELDAPAARVLLDDRASPTARRRAAAALLAAPAYVVYRVDMVNVPLALEVKELKRGALGMRAIGYDRAGAATCALVFTVQNTRETSEWAMDRSDRAVVDPAVATVVRDDLRARLLSKIATLKAQP